MFQKKTFAGIAHIIFVLTVSFVGLLNVSLLEARAPNIIVFLVDDLGSSDVGFAGGELSTPQIDKLARQGAVIEQFYVMHVCSPTRAALLTGRYPIRYGLQTGVIRPNWAYGLNLNEKLLSNSLRDAGYTTGIFGKWHLGMFEEAYLPTSRGFDYQYGNYCGAIDCYTKLREGAYDWHRNDKVARDEGYSTEQLTEEAIRWMKSIDSEKSFFLYVPFNAVHAPLQAPQKYLDLFPHLKGNRKQYAAMLAAVDNAIGEIREVADEIAGVENNIYLFSTDNGGPAPGTVTRNGKLRAGKGTLYEGGLRSCAFITWQGRIAAGHEISEPLHVVDLYPTLLGLAGVDATETNPLDGLDTSALLLGNKQQWQAVRGVNPRPILLNAETDRGALRLGDWKLVIQRPANSTNDAIASREDEQNLGVGEQKPNRKIKKQAGGKQEDETVDEYQLYNLSSDPSETKNLAKQEEQILRQLIAIYRKYEIQAVPALALGEKKIMPTPAVWGEWQASNDSK